MATNGERGGSERRSRRSTRIGIIVLIALVILAVAIVWGVQNWSDDDNAFGPSEIALASRDYRAA